MKLAKSYPDNKIYSDNDDYFEDIFKEIRSAQRSVYIEFYIFEKFYLTERLIHELKILSQKNVTIKIILDGFGSYYYINNHLNDLLKENLPVKIFNPFVFSFLQIIHFTFFKFKKMKMLLSFLNRRNHRKTVCIDEKILFMGSLNWSTTHISKVSKPWRDVGLKISLENQNYFIQSFHRIWSYACFPNKTHIFRRMMKIKGYDPKNESLKMNLSHQSRLKIYRELLQFMNTAQKKIVVGSAYFLPKRSFLRAIYRAKRRGVDIKIITSGPTDVTIIKYASLGLYERLLQEKVELYEYQPSHFHSKYFLIDDICLVGSLNMNHRSLLHDLEIMYQTKDPGINDSLSSIIDNDLKQSTSISIESIKNRPWYIKFISKLLYRLRYIL